VGKGSGFFERLDPRALFDAGDVYRVGYDEERASRRPVRLGVLGAGGVAQAKYLPAIARLRTQWEPVELVAVSTLDAQQAEKLTRIWGVPAYADSNELLSAHSPDAVLVTSADESHRELTLAALDAGAHVLVEKPIARTLADAAEMCRTADTAGLVLLTVCMKRYAPAYAEARAVLDRGELPHPSLFSAKFVLGYDYVDLLESGTVHIFDLARFLTGDVRQLTAVAPAPIRPGRGGSGPENVVITCEFATGAVGTIVSSATALSLHPWERVEIFGDGAWLEVEDGSSLTLHAGEYDPARSWTPVVANTLLSAEEWGGYVGMLEDFLAAVRGADPVATAPWDGYRALELVVATHRSLAVGRPVALPLEPE
jgi:myo-inositol 2-dehydrogenase/D-chiro-inositol 1-dehydrogenase